MRACGNHPHAVCHAHQLRTIAAGCSALGEGGGGLASMQRQVQSGGSNWSSATHSACWGWQREGARSSAARPTGRAVPALLVIQKSESPHTARARCRRACDPTRCCSVRLHQGGGQLCSTCRDRGGLGAWGRRLRAPSCKLSSAGTRPRRALSRIFGGRKVRRGARRGAAARPLLLPAPKEGGTHRASPLWGAAVGNGAPGRPR